MFKKELFPERFLYEGLSVRFEISKRLLSTLHFMSSEDYQRIEGNISRTNILIEYS